MSPRNPNLPTLLAGLLLVGTAAAQTVLVTSDIAVSTTWTANNTYNLQRQIYVTNGATLTIEAGTVVASTAGLGGSLAVTRGSQIIVQGTKDAPVIMTSTADVATWAPDPSHPTGRDPKTGTWREAANEWGNLTIMGRAFISENATPSNTATCNANNVGTMEGLIAQFPGDQRVLYGGGNDDDDSGSIEHLSLRYGGRVIGLNNELNGLSLGGIGRETEIRYLEIQNNVDDGIEIWGGTVELKYFSIWNIGDDSLDIDQGWRGRADFGLIVQGYSLDAAQGSGVGDNMMEIDGAEQSDYQPRTRATIGNMTLIGQPIDGDHGVAFRDGAAVQICNSIFMNVGEEVVRNDNVDGDGGAGYAFNGTETFAETWTTLASTFPRVNPCASPGQLYRNQDPTLPQNAIRDSVFYGNSFANAYTTANSVNVFAPANRNVLNPANSPITSISRAPTVTKGGKAMQRVTLLDARPANDALDSSGICSGGYGVKFRGAFRRNDWMQVWTAAWAFDMIPRLAWCDEGFGHLGVNGVPQAYGAGPLTQGSVATFGLDKAAPSAPGVLILGFAQACRSFVGVGEICVDLTLFPITVAFATDANGAFSYSFPWGAVPAGSSFYVQYLVSDSRATPYPFSVSNVLRGTTQ
ncbi:MAG: hypothetical protein IPM29_25975 [Planctomycetes bacterium]|nr:hypothetical protein [Planctomycetota bacterium]